MSVAPRRNKPAVHHLVSLKAQGEKIVSLTAYDYTTAQIMDASGALDFILVGDSLGVVVLGYGDTLQVTMDDMLHHLKAVRRGAPNTLVFVDMPFMSVQVDQASAIRNAGRMIQEGRADGVKIEGASEFNLGLIRHLTEVGVPVMGHLGLTPQLIQTIGGYKVQGKTIEAVETLIEDALSLEASGAVAVVLEMVPVEVAQIISKLMHIPTIGIGAGDGCDGQILVVDDWQGKFTDFRPRFVRNYMNLNTDMTAALLAFANDIRQGRFPHNDQEGFHFPAEWLAQLQQLEKTHAVQNQNNVSFSSR